MAISMRTGMPSVPRKWTLTVLLGVTVLFSPLLTGSAPTTDMSLLVAMSTLSDVRDSLEEKLKVLEQARDRASQLTPASDEQRLVKQSMELHLRNARDIQVLALSFLGSSSTRYPEYQKYWTSLRQNLLETWQKIRNVGDPPAGTVAALPAAPPASLAPASPPTSAVAPVVQPAPLPGRWQPRRQTAPEPVATRTPQSQLMAEYREAYRRYSEGSPESLTEAGERFSTILRQEPAFHLARYWLAKIRLKQGKPVEAREHARRLTEDQPGLRMASTLLREVDVALGRSPIRSSVRSARPARSPRLIPAMGMPSASPDREP